MASWAKSVVQWRERGYLCLSVPFTWLLPVARAIALQNPNERIAVGGPGAKLLPDYASTFAEIEPFQPEGVLQRHHPEATRTSIGCSNSCWFCSVRTISGEFRVMDDWPLGRIIMDDNLLAAGENHIRRVCERLDGIQNLIIEGLDPKLLTPTLAGLIAGLRPKSVRMGWDSEAETEQVWDAIATWRAAGGAKAAIRPYVLINAGETPMQAEGRMMRLQEAGHWGMVMRYQAPLLRRNEYLAPEWTEQALRDFCRYWNRQIWLGGVAFHDYSRHPKPKAQGVLL